MIIDIHTHTFPDKIAEQTIKKMEQEILDAQGFVVKAATGGTFKELSDSSIKNDIDISMVAPVATRPQQVEKINALSAKQNEKYIENHVFYMGSIHPDCENYKEIIDDIAAMDLKVIKLHPDYQKTFFDDEKYIRIMDYAANKGLGIITHAGMDIGLPQVVHCTPDRVINVLKHIQPELLILAHLGGWNCWDEVEEKLCGLPVYFDTAVIQRPGCPHISDEQFVRIVRKHGADKILFGTDSPWFDQQKALNKIKTTGFTKKELELILGKNADNLFFKR